VVVKNLFQDPLYIIRMYLHSQSKYECFIIFILFYSQNQRETIKIMIEFYII